MQKLILICLLSFQTLASTVKEKIPYQNNYNYKNIIKELTEQAQSYTALSNLQSSAIKYLTITKEFEWAREKWYRPYPTSESIYELKALSTLNELYTLCQTVSKDQAKICNEYKDKLRNRKYSKYKDSVRIIEIPKIDEKAKTFTTSDGKTFSFETYQQITKPDSSAEKQNATSPTTEKQIVTSPTTEKQKVTSSSTDDSEYTCEWKSSLPRKIIRGQGCYTEGQRICVGYVTCGTPGRKFDRMATCSESSCKESDALACARQGGYGSKNPSEVDEKFTNEKQQNNGARGISK